MQGTGYCIEIISPVVSTTLPDYYRRRLDCKVCRFAGTTLRYKKYLIPSTKSVLKVVLGG